MEAIATPRKTEYVSMYMSPELLERIEALMEAQAVKPSRGAMIRHLIELGLERLEE